MGVKHQRVTPEEVPDGQREELLRDVDGWRRIAREIADKVEAGTLPAKGPNGWPEKAAKLAAMIRTQEVEPVRGWAERAIWEELRVLFDDDPEADFDQPPPADWTQPQEQLRREGYESCPRCRRTLPTVEEFTRWRRMSLIAAKRRDARGGAI